MSLVEIINEDIKNAMLSKDKRKLEALRAIKAALLLIKTGKDKSSDEIPETLEMQMLQKLMKQRRETAVIYQQQNRQELADEELYQASIIETYLPAQMSADELNKIVLEIITETKAASIKDMGKVMKEITPQVKGRFDAKRVSVLVQDALK